jgi:N-carbamoylputrescine amidase
VDIIAVPPVTPASSRDRVLVGGRAAAIVSGAFCVWSNRSGMSVAGDPFGGQGWIIDPDGDVLATTSDAEPFATRDLDLEQAMAAKTTYPRYVRYRGKSCPTNGRQPPARRHVTCTLGIESVESCTSFLVPSYRCVWPVALAVDEASACAATAGPCSARGRGS